MLWTGPLLKAELSSSLATPAFVMLTTINATNATNHPDPQFLQKLSFFLSCRMKANVLAALDPLSFSH